MLLFKRLRKVAKAGRQHLQANPNATRREVNVVLDQALRANNSGFWVAILAKYLPMILDLLFNKDK